MAELKSKEGGKFQCYSERGMLSYYFFRYLPNEKNLIKFLKNLEFPSGARNPFEGVLAVTPSVFFSELGLGQEGFGNPDGAIYFKANRKPYMIFVEGKFNETYQKSCEGKSYNSTIKGQLELRWRAVSLFKMDKVKGIITPGKNGVEYLRETEEYREFYKGNDIFYNKKRKGIGAFRRLRLIGGVKEFFDFVGKCDLENIYFLTISDNESNPFDNILKELEPRIFKDGKDKWQAWKQQFCWLSSKEVEEADLKSNNR